MRPAIPETVDLRHHQAFRYLQRLAPKKRSFRLFPLQFNDHTYREELIAAFASVFPGAADLRLDASILGDFCAFESRLEALSPNHGAIHVVGLERWSFEKDPETFFRGLNYHRESLAHHQVSLLFWLTEEDVRLMATLAPDMWAWREMVLDFSAYLSWLPSQARYPVKSALFNFADSARNDKRIKEIKAYLAKEENPSADLIYELGEIYLNGRNLFREDLDEFLSMITDPLSKKKNQAYEPVLELLRIKWLIGLNRPKEALAKIPEVRAMLQKHGLSRQLGHVPLLKAEAAWLAGRFEIAEELLLDLLDHSVFPVQEAGICLRLGVVLESRQRFSQAAAFLKRAIVLSQEHDVFIYLQSMLYFAETMEASGDLATSLKWLVRAQSVAFEIGRSQVEDAVKQRIKAVEMRRGRIKPSIQPQGIRYEAGIPVVYLSFVNEDAQAGERFLRLQSLWRSYGLQVFHIGMATPGTAANQAFQFFSEKADIGLVLLSPDYIGNHFTMKVELPQLQQKTGKSRLFSLEVAPVEKALPGCCSLPKSGMPSETWEPDFVMHSFLELLRPDTASKEPPP